eukprot:Gb_01911 [translate_table: standard]
MQAPHCLIIVKDNSRHYRLAFSSQTNMNIRKEFRMLFLLLVLIVTQIKGCDSSSSSWIVARKLDNHSLPPCGSYCFNIPNNNFSYPLVGLFSCQGTVYANEQWIYNTSTGTLYASNSNNNYCLDIAPGSSRRRKLIPSICDIDRPKASQKWIFEGNHLKSSAGDKLYVHASTNGSSFGNPFPYVYPLYISELNDKDAVNEFSIVDSSLIQSFYTPLPKSNHSNFLQNSFLQPVSTAASGVPLPSPYNYKDKEQTFFYICNWWIFGSVTWWNNSDLSSPLPTSSNSTIINLNHDNPYTQQPVQASVTQSVYVYQGSKYVLLIQVGRNNKTCRNSDFSSTKVLISVNPSTLPSNGTEFSMSEANVFWESFMLIFKSNHNKLNITIRSSTVITECGPLLGSAEMYLYSDTIIADETVTKTGKDNVFKALAASGWTVAAISVIFSMLLCFFLKKTQKNGNKAIRLETGYSFEASKERAIYKFGFKEIKIFTDNFSTLIGEGGFGSVYRGILPEGRVIAVKRSHTRYNRSSIKQDYHAEMRMLCRVHHRSIIDFIGYCNEKGERILVFEFMPYGSLYDRLHGQPMDPLTWSLRMRISSQIALGLEYLHHGANPPIVHRDIKSANILLTEDFSAKVADMGLSKVGGLNANSFSSTMTGVKGSLGYIDPQYFNTSVISDKSDVYSFGVVLLELISGRKAMENFETLVKWAEKFFDESEKLEDMVDPGVRNEVDLLELKLMANIAQLCVSTDPKDRPSMADVVNWLGGAKNLECFCTRDGRTQKMLFRRYNIEDLTGRHTAEW